MTPEEEEKAAIAQTMRDDIAQLVSVESVSFLDRSPVIGAINPIAAPMHIETTMADDGSAVVVGTVTFTKQYEGAPACVHGGFIAAYFDEVLGVAQSTSGNPGMTVNLSINYRSPTPIRSRYFVLKPARNIGGISTTTASSGVHQFRQRNGGISSGISGIIPLILWLGVRKMPK